MKSIIYQQKDGDKILDLISHRDHIKDFENISLGTFNEDDTKEKQFINTILELIDITIYTVGYKQPLSVQITKLKNFNIRVNHNSFRILWQYFITRLPVSYDSMISNVYMLYRDIKITTDESLNDYEYTLTETLMTNKSE